MRVLPALALFLVAAVSVAVTTGSVPVSVADIVSALLGRLGIETVAASSVHSAVFFAIRLPRVLLGVLVGAGLGLSGAAMQGVFRNPLVDPGLLGVSSGAALAAVATIVLAGKIAHGIPTAVAPYLLPIAAFAGGLAAMAVVERIACVAGHTIVSTLLLAGIAINALSAALTGLLVFLANDTQLRTITFWSLGSLGGATWTTAGAALLFMSVPLALLPRWGRCLDALLLGEAEAAHLGFRVEGAKRAVVTLVAVLVGTAVAMSGILGFVGLVVPHLLRLVVGPNHRVLLPGSALLGGSLLVLADAAARTIVVPAELPLGIVTATFGTPFFLALLLRERRRIL